MIVVVVGLVMGPSRKAAAAASTIVCEAVMGSSYMRARLSAAAAAAMPRRRMCVCFVAFEYLNIFGECIYIDFPSLGIHI